MIKAYLKPITQRLTLAMLTVMAFAPASFATILEGANDAQPDGTPDDLNISFKLIANLLIFLVGAVAVIMLIIGGLRYVISQGDSAHVKAAKDTLLYAIIGIVVAILAYAIVNFVAGALTPPPPRRP